MSVSCEIRVEQIPATSIRRPSSSALGLFCADIGILYLEYVSGSFHKLAAAAPEEGRRTRLNYVVVSETTEGLPRKLLRFSVVDNPRTDSSTEAKQAVLDGFKSLMERFVEDGKLTIFAGLEKGAWQLVPGPGGYLWA